MIDARCPGAVLGDARLASHQVPPGKCAPHVWSKRSRTPWAKTGCGGLAAVDVEAGSGD